MNGKQRARWYADIISEAQRLRKKTHGKADAPLLDTVLAKLGEARELALVEVVSGGPDGDD